MVLFAKRSELLGTENAFKVGEDIRRVEASGRDVIRLNLGEPDFNSADNINLKAKQEIDRGNSHYTDPAGIPALREAIAEQVGRTRGFSVIPEQVAVFPGAKPSIAYTLLTYVNPDDEVIYPSPGFPIYESWVIYVGARPVPLHLEESRGFAFTAEDLDKLLTPRTRVLIINSPSNPTGGVLSQRDLEEIAEVVRARTDENFRIYSDEIYEQILFDGNVHRSITSLPGMRERTILVSGHSKTYAMTGWRLGYAVLPTVEEANAFKQLNINIVSCVPPFIQEAGVEALRNPANPAIIAEMSRQFQLRRDMVVDALNAIDGITCARPGGAFYVFPNIAGVCDKLGILRAYEGLPAQQKKRSSPSTLFQLFALYRHGVATLDRRSFGVVGSEGRHFLRLSIAADPDTLKEGINRLKNASRDSEGFADFFSRMPER
ncbi:MAG: aminotransferase class I/II-fold pyridoxal phosphate-dependent enzyme [Deltaproteobacteria bacterium]|nr:aminotransferase class I/II-fold pyridoxal phosphate-dependent enzyme [Deltaproteobacteria bacterium]MBW2306654.1 aminotransferase class I/II-fold pyridoxal phosphate-dependent enzyme [Deltaproteobacteria bacterium]